MAVTTNLNVTKWTAGQSQPEVPVSVSMDIFDGQAGMLTHNMASDAAYTLATTGSEPFEWQYGVIRITDTSSPHTLTGGVDIIFPTYPVVFMFRNDTAEILTVKKSCGTGIQVGAAKWAMLAYTAADADIIRLTADAR